MTEEFFHSQVTRLRAHFGTKALNHEFVRVVAGEVATLPDSFFRDIVNSWIGERKTSNPPLRSDFRNARLAFERAGFNKVVERATNTFHYGLKDILRKHYKVDNLSEAIEIEKLKIRLGDRDEGGGIK